MTGQGNHKIFTADDIRRYLNGQMSEADMFALESAALEDPFLADAIEGFDQTREQINSNPPQDIKELHDRLRKRIAADERRRLPLFLRINIAAILILLAGVGTMVYYLVENREADRTYISQSEAGKTKVQDSVTETMDPTEDAGARQFDQTNQPATSNAETVRPAPEQKREEVSSQALADRPAPQPGKRQSSSAESSNNRFEKDIGYSSANKPGSGVASAPAKNKGASRQIPGPDTITDNKGILSDNNIAATELPDKAVSKSKLQDSIPSRSMKAANTRTSRSIEKAPEVSSPAPVTPNAAPVIGWKAYEIYLKDHRKVPPSLKNIHGKVVVSFTIDQTGKPQNAQVVQSLNKTMDEEAVRLVKEGPVWTATQSPVSTTITF